MHHETFPPARSEVSARVADDSAVFDSLINSALAKLDHLRAHPYDVVHTGRRRSLDAALLADAARARGLEVQELSGMAQIIRDDTRRLGFYQSTCWTLSALDRTLTNDKDLTKRILGQNGLPTAEGRVVASVEEGLKTFRTIGRPVVVKPIRGSGGKGVTVDIRTESEVAAAVEAALTLAPRAVVEECVPCVDLRILVVAGRAVASMLRVPAHITGDGTSTIEQLIAAKNAVRAANAYLQHVPIQITDETHVRLADRGLDLTSIPAVGQRVFLHYKANVASGGDSLEITGLVHPSITAMAERALGCFPSAHHGGIDLLLERFDAPVDEQKVVVCEVNCNNNLPIHAFPLYGEPVDAGAHIIDGYFFAGRDRVPVRDAPRAAPQPLSGERVHTDVPLSVNGCPRLIEALAEPITHSAPARTRSPRGLDEANLTAELQTLGMADVTTRGRLYFAEERGRPVVFDRSGRSIFAAQVTSSPEALGSLLKSAGIPMCASAKFADTEFAEAAEFFNTHRGPWTIRRSRQPHPSSDGGYCITKMRSLRFAWDNSVRASSMMTLIQAPDGLAYSILLVGDEVAAALAVCPPGVVGDGRSTVAELIDHTRSERRLHPFLRHFARRSVLRKNSHLTKLAVPPTDVLPTGQWLKIDRAAELPAGADTVGLALGDVGSLAHTAQRIQQLLDNPPILAVTFAARPGDASHGDPSIAVYSVDPDPVLSRYAFPWAGERAEVYSRAANVMAAGQRHTFT